MCVDVRWLARRKLAAGDHHVNMACGAMDMMKGAAQVRELRVVKLRADLEQSRATLAVEQDHGRLLERFRQHVALRDALVAELLQGRS